jgi:hypothetical protein
MSKMIVEDGSGEADCEVSLTGENPAWNYIDGLRIFLNSEHNTTYSVEPTQTHELVPDCFDKIC